MFAWGSLFWSQAWWCFIISLSSSKHCLEVNNRIESKFDLSTEQKQNNYVRTQKARVRLCSFSSLDWHWLRWSTSASSQWRFWTTLTKDYIWKTTSWTLRTYSRLHSVSLRAAQWSSMRIFIQSMYMLAAYTEHRCRKNKRIFFQVLVRTLVRGVLLLDSQSLLFT